MVRIEQPIDSYLELAAVQRRVFERGGPALYFADVYSSCSFGENGEKRLGERITCSFPVVSNLFGTSERLEYIFRGAIGPLKTAIGWGGDPLAGLAAIAENRWNWRTPFRAIASSWSLLNTARYARPKTVRTGPVLQNETVLERLPQLITWPEDGGPFITLPQVYTENPDRPGLLHSNLGMYRVQIAGNRYRRNTEAGLHYQIHRGIAGHHATAIARNQPLRVSVFVGGAPAMSLAAIMPLPENMSELLFAGMLGRHRISMIRGQRTEDSEKIKNGGTVENDVKNPASANIKNLSSPLYSEADFCICGYLDPERTAPEGPFGDHLGYYSLQHEFPIFCVEKVYHRTGAIWPLTVVGRPPQEDSVIGKFIHELTGEAVPKKIPGVREIRAVDEAGVHPLLLAIGSERYHPYDPEEQNRSAELHTLAHAILGFGQLSLAKYLFLAAREDDPRLSVEKTERFLMHVLSRFDGTMDLHFTTRTNTDTLDYTGGELHRGSKLAIAVCGKPIRELPERLDESFGESFARAAEQGVFDPRVVIPGILTLVGPDYRDRVSGESERKRLVEAFGPGDPINRFPLIVLLDRKAPRATFRDFLWCTFTKSDPANDLDGIGAFTDRKHWGVRGSLVIDARSKPHHAPELIEDPAVAARADRIVDAIS